MNGSTRKTQVEQGQLINIVLGYALNSSYSVSMYCTYLVLSELQFNSSILNPRRAGKVDHEHPITGMLRYLALIKRARRKPNQPSGLPYTEFRHMEAILQKVAADKVIELPNNDELELALYGQFAPLKEENKLPSPSGFVDAQSESDHSRDDEPIPTALSEDEVEEPDFPAPRIDSPPDEPPPLCEEQAKIIHQGYDVRHFAPNGIIRPKVLDHQDVSDYDRESVLKQCSKRLGKDIATKYQDAISQCNLGGGSQSQKPSKD